jgi:putative oxidoreductase
MKQKILSVLYSKTLQMLSQLILGGIFIYASIPKLIQPSDFARVIYNYKILPESLIPSLAIILPIIELLFGILLVLNFVPRISAVVLSLLLVTFIIAIFITIVKGISIDCGCFLKSLKIPEQKQSDSWFLILRDLLFLIPGIILIFFNKKNSQ